jgi:Fe-Mn family superoxide dismutase
MSFELKALPFAEDALEPNISERTVHEHFSKHHAGYVRKLNERVAGGPHENQPLEQVIADTEDATTFNLAAQVWNHEFYWGSMTPEPTQPNRALKNCIEQSFGSIPRFEEAFKDAALNEFGSGWTWLSWDHDSEELIVHSTTDAVNPIRMPTEAVLTLDVWEHAYYLDYQSDRARYVEAFLGNLVNWEQVGARAAEFLHAPLKEQAV